MNSLKKGEGVPLLNFEGGPGAPLLNFRGVPGLTSKLWVGSRVRGPMIPRSRVPGSQSHFYTMPFLCSEDHFKVNITICCSFVGKLTH